MGRLTHALLLSVCLGANAQGEVSVFTTDSLPPLVNTEQADAVYVLADLRHSLSPLHIAYPGSLAAAKTAALRLLNSPEGEAAIARIRQHANAAAMAHLLGIERLPAVLVSPGYVVYGDFDVASALARVEAHRATP